MRRRSARVSKSADKIILLTKQLTARRRTTYVPPFAMTLAYRGMGNVDQVFEWLEKGIEGREPNDNVPLQMRA